MANILVVDDEPLIVKGLKFSLEQEGHIIDTSFDGNDALENIKSKDYDIILLDLMLPIIDGFEVCKKVRETSDVPIIILSAKGEDISKIKGLEIGADDYITKPFNIMELKDRVNAILRRMEKSKKIVAQKHLGDITINYLDRKVTRNSEEINLTSKEFDLLFLLMDNPNKVFSREALLEKVWKYEHFGDLRTVDVHIRKLREKIEDNSSNPVHIMTKWGEGYYFQFKKE